MPSRTILQPQRLSTAVPKRKRKYLVCRGVVIEEEWVFVLVLTRKREADFEEVGKARDSTPSHLPPLQGQLNRRNHLYIYYISLRTDMQLHRSPKIYFFWPYLTRRSSDNQQSARVTSESIKLSSFIYSSLALSILWQAADLSRPHWTILLVQHIHLALNASLTSLYLLLAHCT